MGLTTEYDRHLFEGIPFGVVGSLSTRICTFVSKGVLFCAAPTCEYVTIWNVRKNQRAVMLKAADLAEPIGSTCVVVLNDSENHAGATSGVFDTSSKRPEYGNNQLRFAVGYSDGSMRLFDVPNEVMERRAQGDRESHVSVVDSKATLNGHKSAVLTLAFDARHFVIASGAKDNDIVLWDALNERGCIRLKGHRAAVTKLAFVTIDESDDAPTQPNAAAMDVSEIGGIMSGNNGSAGSAWRSTMLVSCSKDTFVKFWDLDASHCFLTVPAHRSELCDLVYLPGVRYLLTGTLEQPLKVFQLVTSQQTQDTVPQPESRGVVSLSHSSLRCVELGELGRTSRNRVVTIAASSDGRLVAVHGQDRVLELFRILDVLEQRKLRAKKLKKWRIAKRSRTDAEGADAEVDATVDETVTRLTLDEQIVPIGRLMCEARVVHVDLFLNDTLRRANAASQRYGAALLLANNVLDFYAVRHDAQRSALGSSKKRKPLRQPDDFEASERDSAWQRTARIEADGHRGYVRGVAVSNDARRIATVSFDALKLWNVNTQGCVRTFHFADAIDMLVPAGRDDGDGDEEIGEPGARRRGKKTQVNALCCAFVPGDLHVVVGTETGALLLVAVDTAQLTWCASDAHKGAIWSLQILPNKLGLVTGSSDKNVIFWNFELVESNTSGETSRNGARTNRNRNKKHDEPMDASEQDFTGATDIQSASLRLARSRTLAMHDEVLAVSISPDSRLLIVALLDSTVRVLFTDSFNMLTTLYGHSLPVVAVDCSPDSRLCVTASADHSVRIWGLDFGDCHRSFAAHADAVTCVRFGNAAHEPAVLFSSGKDGRVREWDARKLTAVCTLPDAPVSGAACWCVATAPRGEFVVACSQDRSIRVWKRTDQLLILEEEREIERERQLNSAFAHDTDEDRVIPGELNTAEVGIPTRQTDRTLRFVERLTDAIKVFSESNNKRATAPSTESSGPQKMTEAQALLVSYNARSELDLLAKVIQSIRTGDLDDVLLRVSFDDALTLLDALMKIVDGRGCSLQLELACRCAVFLVKMHRNQLISMPDGAGRLRSLVERLARGTREQLATLRSCVGMNRAGAQLLGSILEQRKNEVRLFREAFVALNARKKKRKQKEALEQAHAVLQ